MVTLLDRFCSLVDPNSFSPLALSFSSPRARCENYTLDEMGLVSCPVRRRPKVRMSQLDLLFLEHIPLL